MSSLPHSGYLKCRKTRTTSLLSSSKPMASNLTNLLGIDYGEKRIGLAMANTVAKLPSPAGAILNSDALWEELGNFLTINDIQTIVVGLPRGLDGQETAQTAAVRAFGDKLATYTTIPFFYQDEALTSQKAQAELQERGVSYTKQDVDALAATYILSDYLATHPEV